MILLLTIVFSLCREKLSAQPPGTAPPVEVFEGNKDELPIRAFMFLSESENPVMMPGLSWEEFERLMDTDEGVDGPSQPFAYQSLEISGIADEDRAEMDVTLRLSVESTSNRWISIPLRMSNFHRLTEPEITGVDRHFMTVASDGSGYLLMVKTNAPSEATVRMRVSSRVRSSSTRAIAFQLPDVPSRVKMMTSEVGVTGEVFGRGDETLEPISSGKKGTSFVVESSGGTFTLIWGNLASAAENLSLLEVESRVNIRWDSPQDQPIASVRLTVRSVKGSVKSFRLRLPLGSVVLDTPRLSGGETVELGPAIESDAGYTHEVSIPEDERQPRIDLNFDLQLAVENPSPATPTLLRVPEIIGALRQQGELVVQTSGDYRLRWRSRPWVRHEPDGLREEGETGREYRFRFDRGSFELPLWLSAKERQLRLASESRLYVRNSVAFLEMNIKASGLPLGSQLKLMEASWNLNSIENAETGEEIESFRSQDFRIIEVGSNIADSTAIKIVAERPIDEGTIDVELELPRIVELDEAALIQNATLDLMNQGRTLLVVDLPASEGLTRVSTGIGNDDELISKFRIQNGTLPAKLVGALVDQPPRITLSCQAMIEIDGDQLRSDIDWLVTSPLDLEGRMPVRIPSTLLKSMKDLKNGSTGTEQHIGMASLDETEQFDGSEAVQSQPWVVTVDGVPATLRALDDDRYELVSERLTSGTMNIRWRNSQSRQSISLGGSTELVALPRPNVIDVTVRGALDVELRGSQTVDLSLVDGPTAGKISLDTLPREPLRLRLSSTEQELEQLSIQRVLLRTVIGRMTRYEELVATVQGGSFFRVDLPPDTIDVRYEAKVDGNPVTVQKDRNTLIVPLPGDQLSRVIDLRVWVSSVTPPSYSTVRPTLRVPLGAGRVYWQIIAPNDGHILWASPTLGRSMSWRFEKWKLYRQPTLSDGALSMMTGAEANSVPPGNPYLYVGSDLLSFNVVVVSRTVLWMFTGTFVLLLAGLLTQFPKSRHPLTVVVVAVFFAGLLVIAPDAAVLFGQLALISLVLLIVMITISSLVSPRRSDRLFESNSVEAISEPSTAEYHRPTGASSSGLTSTFTAQASAPTESKS